jgi:hypothetical protein
MINSSDEVRPLNWQQPICTCRADCKLKVMQINKAVKYERKSIGGPRPRAALLECELQSAQKSKVNLRQ